VQDCTIVSLYIHSEENRGYNLTNALSFVKHQFKLLETTGTALSSPLT
jgi:hypothetical protein